jgi:hypothetical protein
LRNARRQPRNKVHARPANTGTGAPMVRTNNQQQMQQNRASRTLIRR